MTPGWPPSFLKGRTDFKDDQGYETFCYCEYEGAYLTTKPAWPIAGQRFAIKTMPRDTDGRCGTFWHIVSEGSEPRAVVPGRLDRVCWARHIIDHFAQTYPARGSADIVWWKTTRKGDVRWVIALADFSHVVVVADRGTYVLLWTAYPVDRPHTKRRLQQEHATYWANQPTVP